MRITEHSDGLPSRKLKRSFFRKVSAKGYTSVSDMRVGDCGWVVVAEGKKTMKVTNFSYDTVEVPNPDYPNRTLVQSPSGKWWLNPAAAVYDAPGHSESDSIVRGVTLFRRRPALYSMHSEYTNKEQARNSIFVMKALDGYHVVIPRHLRKLDWRTLSQEPARSCEVVEIGVNWAGNLKHVQRTPAPEAALK